MAVVDIRTLISRMEPRLNPGRYVYATLPAGKVIDPDHLIALVREPEGLSVVVEESVAAREGLAAVFPCAWITLTVPSDLAAIGLTAAFSSALAREGVSCNVVAGRNHDHLFVPASLAGTAMTTLRKLQSDALRTESPRVED